MEDHIRLKNMINEYVSANKYSPQSVDTIKWNASTSIPPSYTMGQVENDFQFPSVKKYETINSSFAKEYDSTSLGSFSNNIESQDSAQGNSYSSFTFCSAFEVVNANSQTKLGYNFLRSGQKLLKKAISLDQIIQNINNKQSKLCCLDSSSKTPNEHGVKDFSSSISEDDKQNNFKYVNSLFTCKNTLWFNLNCQCVQCDWTNKNYLPANDSSYSVSNDDNIKSLGENEIQNIDISNISNIYNNNQNQESDYLLYKSFEMLMEGKKVIEKELCVKAKEQISSAGSSYNASTPDKMLFDIHNLNKTTDNFNSVPNVGAAEAFYLGNSEANSSEPKNYLLNKSYNLRNEETSKTYDSKNVSAFQASYGVHYDFEASSSQEDEWRLDSNPYCLEVADRQDYSFPSEYLNNAAAKREDVANSQDAIFPFYKYGETVKKFNESPVNSETYYNRHYRCSAYARPCSSFVQGSCTKPSCKFSHNLRDITCRFWMKGSCYKGGTCPFLHDYVPKSVADHHEFLYNSDNGHRFSLESEEDFPALPSSQCEKLVLMSDPVDKRI